MSKPFYLASFFAAIAIFLLPQQAFALSNFVGIEAGVRANGLSITTVDSNSSPVLGGGGGSCSASNYVDDGVAFIGPGALPGSREYAPDISGTWSDFAYHGYCKYPLAFGLTASFGDNLHVGYLWLYLAGKKVPAETDIRVCLQARSGGTNGEKQCTPWASELASNTWGDSAFAYDSNGKDAETFRIKVDSRAMLGRSITDVKLRLKMIDVGSEANWITTEWSSKGGGWTQIWKPDSENSYYLPSGSTGEYGDGAKIGMKTKIAYSPTPDLSVNNISLNSGSTIQGSTITLRGTITNQGNASTGVGYSYKFQYRWGPSDAWLDIGGPTSVAPLGAGAAYNVASNPLSLTRAGNLEVQLIADSGGVINELDETDNSGTAVIAIAPPPGCTYNGTTYPHGSQVSAYTTNSVPYGATCATAMHTCNSGSWSGGPMYTSCSPVAGLNCSFNGSVVLHGASVKAYNPPSDTGFFATCPSETRTCTNGVLSGSYTNASCPLVGACIRNGVTVANGESRTFYNTTVTPGGESCTTGVNSAGNSFDSVLTCNNGVFTSSEGRLFSYQYKSCTPGVVIPPSTVTQGPISLSSNENKVRKDGQVRLTWDGANSTSCTLTGTNGFNMVARTGSNVNSLPITQKTVFTLTCSLGASIKQTTLTVDIVAAVKEI